MTDKEEEKKHCFLSAQQLIQIRGISSLVWDDWEQSETALPRTGKKRYEPTGSWLENMQLENGLKNRKKLIEIERVTRSSQLAVAEWLPGIQKAKVIKKSGQKWDNFGTSERDNLYLLPEEALILLEMNTLEVLWNGMPLSIQQAYEVMINGENSKCTLDEYRVFSQLVKWSYKLQRFQDKSAMESKNPNTPKRIIMNPEGLWTPNTSPTKEKEVTSYPSTSKTDNGQNDVVPISSTDKSENDKSPKRLGIVSEETVLGSIKIIKNTSPPTANASSNGSSSKWSGSRIQRNVKLMPKRAEKAKNATEIISEVIESPGYSPQKRHSDLPESSTAVKKARPEIIELSDDEIEEIPRPMTRAEILNTFPNLAHPVTEVIVEIPRSYLPPGVKPSREIYHFNRNALMNPTTHPSDSALKSNVVPEINNVPNGHFYSQGSTQCQSITTYNSNNGYEYRGMRYQQRGGNSYYQQNVTHTHNAIHNPLAGAVLQSNYFNLVLEVMGSMVRSFRQQQFQQTTTFCQNMQIFPPRFPQLPSPQRMPNYPMNSYDVMSNRYPYYRRGGGAGPAPSTSYQRGRGYRPTNNDCQQRPAPDEVFQSAFTKRPGVDSWTDLKKKWREEATITIEDEEPMQIDVMEDNSEIQVVETISPLVSSRNGISTMAEVYERLRIIKSATDKTVRSRKPLDYYLSYEVFPVKQQFRKSAPGEPICRLYVINSKKEALLDANKLQRLQQESKDVPVVVAFVSQSCISYIQPGVVQLPNLS